MQELVLNTQINKTGYRQQGRKDENDIQPVIQRSFSFGGIDSHKKLWNYLTGSSRAIL
jgi:hypothetical protein